jgi:hypothetical protein
MSAAVQNPGIRWRNNVRRIAFCGAMRVSPIQWQLFLDCLGALPFQVRFHAYAWRESIPQGRIPPNVRFEIQPYIEKERDLVSCLRESEYDACYLAVWNDDQRRLFGKTSLSSKLVTYSALACPVIVDAAPDDVVSKLVAQYGAGVLLSNAVQEGFSANQAILLKLFSDEGAWQAMAEGAIRMCRERFSLERNIPLLRDLMIRSAGKIRIE